MERRRLGGTDLELSVIGLGTWVFGGRWGGADDADSEAACHAALDAGINWIDTADIYGQGRAERIVGRVVRARGDDVVVATKGGVAWEAGPDGLRIWREASADYLRMSLERSLRALGMDGRRPLPGPLAGRRRARRGDDRRARATCATRARSARSACRTTTCPTSRRRARWPDRLLPAGLPPDAA